MLHYGNLVQAITSETKTSSKIGRIENASPIPLHQESWNSPQNQGYAPRRVPDKGLTTRDMLPLPVREYYAESDIMSELIHGNLVCKACGFRLEGAGWKKGAVKCTVCGRFMRQIPDSFVPVKGAVQDE